MITAPNEMKLNSEIYLNKLKGKIKKTTIINAQKDLSGFIKYSQVSSPKIFRKKIAINLFY